MGKKTQDQQLAERMDGEPPWGKAWRDILESAFNGTSFTPELEQKHGLRKYSYLTAVSECAASFYKVAGQGYAAYRGVPFARTLYDGKKMATYQLPVLRRIVDVAWDHLTPEEFSAVTARALFRAPEKKSFENMADIMEITLGTVIRSYFQNGRIKLIEALKVQAPELAAHPFLTYQRRQKPFATKDVPEINIDSIYSAKPEFNERYLLSISETLFDEDFHYVAAHCVLAAPEVERNYDDVARTLGVSGSTVRKKIVHIREKLNEAIAFENPALGLEVPEPLKRRHHAHATKKYTQINEALMDLELPIVKAIYDKVKETGCTDNEIFVFCSTHLYRAPAKMSLRAIEYNHGITISTGRSYCSAVKKKMREALRNDGSSLTDHPILRFREYTQPQPFIIADSNSELRRVNGTQELDRIASTLFSHRQYYALTRREMRVPGPDFSDLAKQMGVPKTIVKAAIENGRKTMLEAIKHESVPDYVRNNPIVKRWKGLSSFQAPANDVPHSGL